MTMTPRQQDLHTRALQAAAAAAATATAAAAAASSMGLCLYSVHEEAEGDEQEEPDFLCAIWAKWGSFALAVLLFCTLLCILILTGEDEIGQRKCVYCTAHTVVED